MPTNNGASKMENVRILIQDLTKACIALNQNSYEVLVVASGSMYATLSCDYPMRVVLTANKVHWGFD